MLEAALRKAVRLRDEVAASAASSNLAVSSYRWTVAGSTAEIISALLALLMYVQAAAAARQVAPPTRVTVVVEPPDPTEIDHRVDERLRDLEQHRQAEHVAGDPGSPSTER